MKIKLDALTEEIFDDVPYSERTESLKDNVCEAFNSEYTASVESGQTEMQALGGIMSKYGSRERAMRLVGENLPEYGKLTDSKIFEKRFRHIRLLALFMAWIGEAASISIAQGIALLSPMYIITVAVYLALLLIPVMIYKRLIKPYSFENICLSPETRERFYLYRDRYRKRLLNSVLILAAAILYVALALFNAHFSDMNTSELTAVFNGSLAVPSIALLLLFDNILNCHFLLRASAQRERKAFWKYFCKFALLTISASTFLIAVCLIIAAYNINPTIVIYVAGGIGIAAGIVVSYHKRAGLMRKNLCINKPIIAVTALILVIAFGFNYMKQDVYIIQPYIDSIGRIEHTDREILYDSATGVYTIKADKDDFKILHLTDIHIGGSVSSSYKDFKALEACKKLIEYTKPDFVIVTGDLVFPVGVMSISLNNEAPVRQFAAFMRNIGIPWAFTFGNHDTEPMATGSRDEICSLYESLSYKTSHNLLYPYIQPDITGRNNQLIKIENPDGSIRQALFLIDSNDYTGEKLNAYDYIHDDQVDWYADEVRKLQSEQPGVQSMAFFHMPLQQYRTAYELYEAQSDEVKYFFGMNGEAIIDKVCCSDHPSKFFDIALELGSTQAMFCGHDHYNNLSVEYKDIRLSYGMSIDYLAMPGIDRDTEQRGGELITLHSDGSFDLIQVPLAEIDAVYDSETAKEEDN